MEQEDRVQAALHVVRALAARVAAYPGGEDAGYAALPEHELQRLADANAVLEAAVGEDGGALESGEEDWEEDNDEDADDEARGSGDDEHDSDAAALSSSDEAYGSDDDASGDGAYDSSAEAAGSGDDASGSDAEAGASGDEAYGSDPEPYDSADEAYGSAEEYGSDPEAYGGGDEAYGSGPDAYGGGSEGEDAEGGTETEFLDGLGAGSRRAWYAAGFRPAGGGLHRQFLLTGDTGTGKSVALAALAHYMRALGAVVRRLVAVRILAGVLGFQGWKTGSGAALASAWHRWLLLTVKTAGTGSAAPAALARFTERQRLPVCQMTAVEAQVVYLPAAAQLTGGGFFYKSKAHPGMWDTAESAKLILSNLVAAHRAALEQLPAAGRPAAAQLADDSSARAPGKKKAMGAQEGPLGGAEAGSEPGKDQGPTVAQVRPTLEGVQAALLTVCTVVW